MKKEIENRTDVEKLVNQFYLKVRKDEILGYIFDDMIKLDWDKHLPIMYSFWSSILLGEHSFRGNPMKKHIDLAQMGIPMTQREFERWLGLFFQTIDEFFIGEIAQIAKDRAQNIARLMLINIEKNKF